MARRVEWVAGVDEAGRGPLAGPVTAAAVILCHDRPIEGLADSKLLSPAQRERLAVEIRAKAIAWAVAKAEPLEIDNLNILRASLVAMQRAVAALHLAPTFVQVDGNQCPPFHCPAEAIVRGDQSVAAISAASILAKVSRDQEMLAWDAIYPGYGFAQHKGYPTKAHIDALVALGATPIHRRSFAPVRSVLAIEVEVKVLELF